MRLTPRLKPPSRGVRASASRYAPMSSARTPTRVGFHGMWVYKGWHPFVFFAAPMVGASPDNMGAQRLAEGGVPTSGAGSAQGGLSQQTGGQQKELESDPN